MKKYPANIQLPGGVKYGAHVLKVVEKDEFGSPKKLEVFTVEDIAKFEGGEEFWVVYCPPDLALRMAKSGSKKDAS